MLESIPEVKYYYFEVKCYDGVFRKFRRKYQTVYSLTNKANGKRYIGLTSNANNRLKSHMSFLKCKKHSNNEMQEDYNRGLEFEFEILETDITNESASAREMFYMLKYKTYDSQYGYNNNDRFFKYKGKPTKMMLEISEKEKADADRKCSYQGCS